MTDASPALVRIVAAGVHGRCLVEPPASGRGRHWLVGFHGYAHNAVHMLEMLRQVPRPPGWLLVSVQALHPFYNRADDVVANWMTRQDREHAIADNIAYVDAVIETLAREFGEPGSLVFAGFSQGAAMAYRAGVAGRRPGNAILAVAGDVPPELEPGGGRRWPLVRIVVGAREQWYTAERMNRDVERLKAGGVEVSATTYAGGHEWTAEVSAAAGTLLREIGDRGGLER
jgi:predicted esterase